MGLGGLAGFGGDAGLRMNKVDGEWYVSIFGTTFDALFGALESVDRADIEELLDGLQDGSFDPFGAMPGLIEDELEGLDPGATLDPTQDSTLDPPASTPDDTTADGDTTAEDGGAADPAADCYMEQDAAVALECMLAAQALDDEVYIPPAVRFPECGVSTYSWTYSWGDLDDAQFIETVTTAKECFDAKVASGELEDYEVPAELTDPSCYEGVNPYALDDFEEQSDAVSEYFDCAFA